MEEKRRKGRKRRNGKGGGKGEEKGRRKGKAGRGREGHSSAGTSLLDSKLVVEGWEGRVEEGDKRKDEMDTQLNTNNRGLRERGRGGKEVVWVGGGERGRGGEEVVWVGVEGGEGRRVKELGRGW